MNRLAGLLLLGLILLLSYSNCTDIRIAPRAEQGSTPPGGGGGGETPPTAHAYAVGAQWGKTVGVTAGSLMRWGSQTIPYLVTPIPVEDESGPVSGVSNLEASAHNVCFMKGWKGYCVGHNYYNQVQSPSTQWIDSPTPVLGGEDLRQVAPSYGHICAILFDKRVKCWGLNIAGQIGIPGAAGTVTSPSTVAISGVEEVQSEYYHTCARVQLGEVKCWGSNNIKQVGNATAANPAPAPISVLEANGQPFRGATQLALGVSTSCALKSGQIFCWGAIGRDQSGGSISTHVPTAVGGFPDAVKTISAGGGTFCAITEPGALYCWGSNSKGQVGVGSLSQYIDSPQVVTGMSSGVTGVSVGHEHACAVRNEKLWCWGDNSAGQLGNGYLNPTLVPIEVYFP